MNNDFDMDMEELESRLYSQVHHSNANDYESQIHLPNPSEIVTNMRQQNSRYFRTKISMKVCGDGSNYIPLSHNNVINPSYTIPWKAKVQASDFFNADSNIANEMPAQLNNQFSQIVHIANPHNNLVIPQISTDIVPSHEYLEANQVKTNFKGYLHRQAQRQQKKQKKMERFRQKRNEKKRLIREQKEAENLTLNDSVNNPGFTVHYLTTNNISSSTEKDIVTISDSDDSCVEIPKHRDLIILSSDESDTEEDKNINTHVGKMKECTETCEQSLLLEKKNILDKKSNEQYSLLETEKTFDKKNDCSSTVFSDDDVLLIDDIPKNLEIIDIDCDSKSLTNCDSSKISSNKSIGSCSTNSDPRKLHLSADKFRPSIRRRAIVSGERNELLKTPDSASNDFIDNTLDLQQKKFNFGLHGSDFGNNHTFIKPKSHTDIYETESSCSASDNSTPIKNSVFHEVEFENPNKELFSESNLETFGNYITPNRNNKLETASNSKSTQIVTKASRLIDDLSPNFNSDSSSESDYDGDKLYLNKAKRKLSDLTSMNLDHVVSNSSNTTEKHTSEIILKKKIKSNCEINLVNQNLQLSHENDQPTVDFNKLDLIRNKPEVYCISDEEISISGTTESKNNLQLANYNASAQIHENNKFKGLETFAKYWTTDMNKFYNSSWGREDFSVEKVQKTMSDDRKLWKIISQDQKYYGLRTPRRTRCHRCKEIGHMAVRCPNSNRSVICSLCGQNGHYEVRCPNALCTLCGSPGGYGTYCSSCANWRYIQCNICSMYGHISTKCPDLWRRYHLTTQPGPIVKPIRQTYRSTENRWCSGCAKCGHYEYKCKMYTRSHHSVDPYVKQYTDIYNFPKTHEFVIHCNNEQFKNETDKKKNENKNNAVENLNADFKSVVREKNMDNNNKEVDQNLKNLVFPSVEMIPPYFREHVTLMDRRYNSEYGGNTNISGNSICIQKSPVSRDTDMDRRYNSEYEDITNINGNSIDIQKSSVSKDSEILHNTIPTQNVVKSTYTLNYKLFAFLYSSKGIDFIKYIQKQPNVSIKINKNIDEESGGVIEMYGHLKKIKGIEHQIENFIRSVPKLKDMPKFSKEFYRFLLRKLDKVERIVGNCKALHNNLSKLKLQLAAGKGASQTRKKIKETKLHLNMLLFGKLRLGDGQKHMNNLEYWQKEFQENDNYKIPLNILYDLFDSYSYIFLDTVNHNYKIFCGTQTNKNRYARNPLKDKKLIYRYYKLVEKKCRKFNMLDDLQELNHFRSAIFQPNFSVKAFKEFMIYCHKFLHFVKTQVL